MKELNAVNKDKCKYILKFRNHCNSTGASIPRLLSRFQNHPCRAVSGVFRGECGRLAVLQQDIVLVYIHLNKYYLLFHIQVVCIGATANLWFSSFILKPDFPSHEQLWLFIFHLTLFYLWMNRLPIKSMSIIRFN